MEYRELTETKVAKLPKCDFCTKAALYDAKTIYGPWANMCREHWTLNARSYVLGTGIGQRLIVDDKPEQKCV